MPFSVKTVPQYMSKKRKAGLGLVSRDSQGFRSPEMSIVTRQVQGQDGKLSLWVSGPTGYTIRHRHVDKTAWARTLQCYSQTKGGQDLASPKSPKSSSFSAVRSKIPEPHYIRAGLEDLQPKPWEGERKKKFAVAIRATQGPDEPLKNPAADQCGLQWVDKPVLTIPHVPDLLLQLGVIAQCRKEQTRCLYDKVNNSQCSLLTHTVSRLIRDNS